MTQMQRRKAAGLWLALWALAACSGRDGETDGGAADSDFPGTGLGTNGGDGDGDGEKFDLGGGSAGSASGGGESNPVGCEKVDFVFVIDSSRSMEDEQDNLLASFPEFINAIRNTLMIDDFQLMAVDAGAELDGSGCDGTLGAGRTRSGAGTDCGLPDGQRYATSDQADLESVFSCAAARGIEGATNEETMEALLESIGPLAQPGECNEGFLRPDALLVVVIMTDEEDDPNDTQGAGALDGSCNPADTDRNSSGDPSSWASAVAAAKAGNPRAVVVLSLIGDCDVGGDCEGMRLQGMDLTSPISGAEPAPRIRQFTESFDFGSVGPICADDFIPFFTSAVSVVGTACDGFVPPG